MTQVRYPDCYPLVVDDDQDYTLVLRRAFERIGVPRSQIFACSDGEEAIALLSKNTWMPSFVMLDQRMPKRSGLEVLEWIRSKTPLSKLLVFMLTSYPDPHLLRRASEMGAGSCIAKPMAFLALEKVLEGFVTCWKNRSPVGTKGSLTP